MNDEMLNLCSLFLLFLQDLHQLHWFLRLLCLPEIIGKIEFFFFWKIWISKGFAYFTLRPMSPFNPGIPGVPCIPISPWVIEKTHYIWSIDYWCSFYILFWFNLVFTEFAPFLHSDLDSHCVQENPWNPGEGGKKKKKPLEPKHKRETTWGINAINIHCLHLLSFLPFVSR